MYSKEQQIQFTELSKKYLQSPATAFDIESLKTILRYHEWKYSIENNPVISDTE